jgi:hypothetical protein
MLIERDLEFRLSENFRLKEFFVSRQFPEHEADMRNKLIRGDISDSVLLRVWAACVYVLQPLRYNLGPVIITSCYRTPALNQIIPGSNPVSWHLFGQHKPKIERTKKDQRKFAVDFYVLNEPIQTVANFVIANIQFERIVVYLDDGFIHAQGLTGFDSKIKQVF